ncbi:glycoside hydrolase family 130 protein [Gaetbulibacter aestuarii]|uniref:Glycoside hydrolase family 130 protein n=1 Tax=Gaetbulibacter aestuarii TaxID=1502358 RepID=A0ABW7N1D1_9FLAO
MDFKNFKNCVYLLFLMLVLSNCVQNKTYELVNDQVNTWGFHDVEKVDSLNPVLKPSTDFSFKSPISNETVYWESRNVLNPAAVVHDNKVYLFYRAQDSSGTSRIGLATSKDGLHFNKIPEPVLYPDEDSMMVYEWNYKKLAKDSSNMDCKNCLFDGIEDPRIIAGPEDNYIMTYTAYDGKTARLSVATSKDLLHWTKHGLAFQDEKYRDMWSKSGAIVAEFQDDNVVAKKINGSYWMYFGDTDIFLAKSQDLIHWEVCENAESKKAISVLHPRSGYFDSRLVEPGPFALYTEKGIVLIYNGSNAANFNDQSLPKFTYAAGQALFDKEQPYKLMNRTTGHFIYPDKPYEMVGEVNLVCFVEGLVDFSGHWFLYYGTADSKIAVATSVLSE